MKFKVYVTDTETKQQSENVVEVRKNTTMKTVVLKGVEKHVEQYAADPLNFMSEVKSLHREAYDLADLTEWLKQDLDLSVSIADLNNHKYYNEKEDRYTTSHELGQQSYADAWNDQLNEEDAEKDFAKYIPDFDTIVEHGNEIASEEWFLEEWEMEE